MIIDPGTAPLHQSERGRRTLQLSDAGGVRLMSRKDGTPYPGWPKGAPE